MDFGVLADFNPWWQRGAVPQVFLGARKRLFFGELVKYIDVRFIVLLYGLRRVGKTTALYQLIAHLLEKGVDGRSILYFSFDERQAPISEVVSAFEENVLRKRVIDSGRVFFFFDEIQKVDDWESKIKVLYDLHPNLKIFLSGSAAVSLRKKSAESLAGRIFDLRAEPLSFGEFLEWRGIKSGSLEPRLAGGEMAPLLADYLRKGGFPEITFEESDGAIKNYVKNTVLEKIIYKDIAEEFGAKDLELLRVLIEMFAAEPGMIVNADRLSKDLGRSKITVTNYIEYLLYGLLIREVRNLRPNLLLSSRKGKKIYPSSTAFCFAMQTDFHSDRSMEKVFETAVCAKTGAQYYYRNAFEVDFVVKGAQGSGALVPIEVKRGRAEQSQLSRFMLKFGAKNGILVSKDQSWEKGGVKAMPLWEFLLKEPPVHP